MENILSHCDIKYRTLPLPEDVDRELKAGNLTTVREKIAYYLTQDTVSKVMKKRMLLELENLKHIEDRYTVDGEEALKMMASRGVKDFTAEELEDLRLKGIVDWRYVDGQVRYIDSFAGSLVKAQKGYAERVEKSQEEPENAEPTQEVIDSVKDGDLMAAHIHIRHTLIPDEEIIRPGEILTAHLPAPKEGIGNQMKNIKVLATSHEPVALCQGDTLQPTVCFREPASKDITFWLEYELDHQLVYHDMSKVKPEDVDAAEIPEDAKKYLEEKLPQIVFTPYLRLLAQEIVGDETNLLKKARAIYDYVTQNITYRFAPNYACIDNIPEYCAKNRRGDCGIQALLFINLCRIAGIPARWQSGLVAEPGDIGEHDWALIYVPSVGWVHVDVSYGGGAYKNGKMDRWDFYFGNMDPYRLPLNEEIQEEFDPPKKYMRFDPYDSQDGELEYDDEQILFGCRRKYEDLGIQLIR